MRDNRRKADRAHKKYLLHTHGYACVSILEALEVRRSRNTVHIKDWDGSIDLRSLRLIPQSEKAICLRDEVAQ
jgi:hypothetical protein